eukprot:348761_1
MRHKYSGVLDSPHLSKQLHRQTAESSENIVKQESLSKSQDRWNLCWQSRHTVLQAYPSENHYYLYRYKCHNIFTNPTSSTKIDSATEVDIYSDKSGSQVMFYIENQKMKQKCIFQAASVQKRNEWINCLKSAIDSTHEKKEQECCCRELLKTLDEIELSNKVLRQKHNSDQQLINELKQQIKSLQKEQEQKQKGKKIVAGVYYIKNNSGKFGRWLGGGSKNNSGNNLVAYGNKSVTTATKWVIQVVNFEMNSYVSFANLMWSTPKNRRKFNVIFPRNGVARLYWHQNCGEFWENKAFWIVKSYKNDQYSFQNFYSKEFIGVGKDGSGGCYVYKQFGDECLFSLEKIGNYPADWATLFYNFHTS